jgi:hypothetical protein
MYATFKVGGTPNIFLDFTETRNRRVASKATCISKGTLLAPEYYVCCQVELREVDIRHT